jgi:hypothetical protein
MKKIDFDKGSFEANGKTYKIIRNISIGRFIEYEKLEIAVGLGIDFKTLAEKLKEIHELCNKQKLADIAVLTHNTLTGIVRLMENRTHPILMLSTIFLVTEDEDLATWSEDEANLKVQDWQKEGIDIQDFFTLAFNLVPGFLEVSSEISQLLGEKEESQNTIKSK